MLGIPCSSSTLWKSTQAQLSGPAYTIKPRRDKTKKQLIKGPGSNKYTPKRLKKSHSYTIGIRLPSSSCLSTRDLSIPCATKYNISYNYKSLYDKSPSWTIKSRTILDSE